MQTSIAPELADDARVIDAEKTLRKCVHCGFCLATCPTYNLLGDELDSPRGRIYLIKQIVEGATPTIQTLTHLDRCLTCRNCETTCPSGVEYGHLLDNGRSLVEEQVSRPLHTRILRKAILSVLPYKARISPLVKLGQTFGGLLPAKLKAGVPSKQDPGDWPAQQHSRRMLVLDGCVQPAMAPATNAAAARVLGALGIDLINVKKSGCCGAVHFHLNEQNAAKDFMRRNIDAWWPHIEIGAEAIITTASGCGVMVKDYGHALADDEQYKEKAARVSSLCKDIVEVIKVQDLSLFESLANKRSVSLADEYGPIAFHPPCTLQHGQRLPDVTETVLKRIGFNLVPVQDAHLCCGSAGTYSIFQPELSQQLKQNKLDGLATHAPKTIATANIGCQLHLQSGTQTPVVHWIQLLDKLL